MPSLQLRCSYGMLVSIVLIGAMFLVGSGYLLWDISTNAQANRLMQDNLGLRQELGDLRVEIDDLDRQLGLLQIYSLQVDLSGSGPWLEEESTELDPVQNTRKRLAMLRQQAQLILPQLLQRAENAKESQLQFSIIPRSWPVRGYFTSGFGYRRSPFTGRIAFHDGIDIAAPNGTKVLAPSSGRVIMAEDRSGYGRMIEIDHGHGIRTRYAHNARFLVKVGDIVQKGSPIATVGSTGRSTGPHLHYEMRIDGVAVDPMMYLPP
jgi:murein DD-endopeptidase MepM/ murein hydrolase activator NlpD